jgi:hypothetical protein
LSKPLLPLQLGVRVRLEPLAHHCHVEGVEQVAVDVAVETLACDVLLGGGGAYDGMSVKIDHASLRGAIDKLSTLANSIESQRNAVTSGTPISLPPLPRWH